MPTLMSMNKIGQFNIHGNISFLGVSKKWLLALLEGSHTGRISAKLKMFILDGLQQTTAYCPTEFQRRPRSLTHIHRWTATEFRQFLLYVGPAVLKKFIDAKFYHYFITLHFATRILCDPNRKNREMFHYANELYRAFVQDCEQLFSKNLYSHNVHNLVHISWDTECFGTLDEFSCFRFESYLAKLKKLVRSPRLPVQQICRR